MNQIQVLVYCPQNFSNITSQQKHFFATDRTKEFSFRIEQLKNLKEAINKHQEVILNALKTDLNKPEFEGYLEIAIVKQEINHALKHIKSWLKPKKVRTPIEQFPASAYIYPEPLGSVLIIGPWNYPFCLTILPLVGAISAGNCAVLKPSEIAAKTSSVIADIINNTFSPDYIAVVEGGVKTCQQLLGKKFDHIFFTGGTKVGQIIMELAAKTLTTVTLELGGKSPCIVDENVNIKEAAKRITWGKFINAGQTCVAPDYLLVNRRIKNELLTNIKKYIQQFYGDNPATSPDYARIINDRQFERLTALLKDGNIIIGGQTLASERYIAPTVIENVSYDAALMQEEIFGPILTVLEYSDLEEAIALINSRPKPLALYFFSQDKAKQQLVLKSTSSGGVCINDTMMQASITELPFGGIGDSGMGNYHGKASFDTFSHYKSVLKKTFLFDFNWRYAPYKNKVKQLKRLFRG
ncbi:MAG: aldehyde dehydrogenase [Moorea sp. SIOASIH]|uniref:aldehyde dehydrogenase n=1 Tax=Moorena sp. SIOASIH TaxID=2607817 RepID=UPI0013B784EC|nr:aldehyde dehydrogenase [Moorena sp. SIOASIH]NEO41310.1 aldehyde dehydrogenase [Moorena sp. SIOASIH]